MVKSKNKSELKYPKIGFNYTAVWYFGITLFFLFLTNANAEVKTTGNLLPNSNFETGNLNHWTSNGDVQVINDCCELNNVTSNYDVEFGDAGYIETDINLISNDITQAILNNGIEVLFKSEWQNGEGGEGSWAPHKGNADSFTVRLQIKDDQQNVLATSTQTRQTVTGIEGAIFTDTLIYGGTGSNIGNVKLSGYDSAAPAILGGPNLDNLHYSFSYDDTVLTIEETQHINTVVEELIETLEYTEEIVFEEYIPEEIETVSVEEIVFEEVISELPTIQLTEEENQFIEETVIFTEVAEETIIETVEIEEESIEIVEEVFNEVTEELIVETPEEINEETETEVVSETEAIQETSQVDDERRTETEVSNNSRSIKTTIDVAEIGNKVAAKIKNVDDRLKVTQILIAKVMSSNNSVLNNYSQINMDIFKQPELNDRNIDSYTNRTYVDIRNIYSNQHNMEDVHGY
tara:strand:+ start:2073 stop:3458 length:1386 start_codon:yes stop_codon:yes gene_type:complete